MAAPDFFSDTSQFDVARKRAQQQSDTNLQTRKDALARRFAQLGNLDSGARIKQEENAANDESQNLQNANDTIDAAQQGELRRRGEIKQGQEFASGEAQKGREFATNERLGGQGFMSDQNKLSRDAQESQFGRSLGQQASQFGMSLDEQKAARAQQGTQFDKQYGLNEKQVDNQKFAQDNSIAIQWQQLQTAIDQFNKTFGEEQRVNDLNVGIANDANKSPKKWDISQLSTNNTIYDTHTWDPRGW